ncbi:TPA: phage tail protein [Enterobacter hormaechei subsp. steigerwaltii]|nr:phage tail protein [Enterobacter hormaechei subsp. steigerwaltii]HED2278526.1 phage tail protein [Enterobacter hormaechei subsp. steigerwaltii]HED3379921.1 phage tail protein [Enterobacter hormaechei subsp. steigerwaltii]HED3416257.1 phage tail protein [Enterobacter hormaechei subsp. steigerwaltii]HED3562685.1 phage tail protein [Enterobacter hormaechei subsp. steigerwaltii]
MLYNTGTIAISGNTLTGTGTNFTAAGSLIRNGCTVIAMTSPVQVFQITTIGSATSLTVTPAANPAVPAGTRFAILLSDSLSVDGLAQDIAETFTMYQRYMSGFADVMNGTSDVTITINGTAVTVPGQKSLAKKGANSDITSLSGLETALSINQGGTGAKNAADARSYLGLVDGSGLVPLSIGGTGGKDKTEATRNLRALSMNGALLSDVNNPTVGEVSYALYTAPGGTGLNGAVFTFSCANNSAGYLNQLSIPVITSRLFLRSKNAGNNTWTTWAEFYSTANTTKSSDGTIKAASPVARIVKSREETERADVAEDGFSWCGCGTANAEAEGIKISRLDVGVYVLTGSAGLASEGWQLLPPMDPGGMGELGAVEAEQTESGGLTIRLFKRKYMLSEEGEIVKTKGAPIDVPANSWIDVRLDMPEDSIWKTRASEASLELTEQPEDIQP